MKGNHHRVGIIGGGAVRNGPLAVSPLAAQRLMVGITREEAVNLAAWVVALTGASEEEFLSAYREVMFSEDT